MSHLNPPEKLLNLDSDFLAKLEKIDDDLTFPVTITEGLTVDTATDPHVEKSEHYTGEGIDLEVKGGWQRYKLVELALKHGIQRIGVYDRHIHLGCSKTLPSPVLWQGISK